ncbi:hypothetical protein N9112_00270 [bacterium]|nr:hypothetical protein [bacterium]
MQSNDIYYAIRVIAEEPSKNAKIELLAEFIQTVTGFEQVLELAYNPFKRYYIQKRIPINFGKREWGVEIFGLLGDLSSRGISGGDAIDTIAEYTEDLTEESWNLFWDVMEKDLKCGAGAKSINKAMSSLGNPALITETPYMRCSLPKHTKLDEWSWDNGVFSQLKLDGAFANVTTTYEGVTIVTTRQGQEYPEKAIRSFLNAMKGKMLRGIQRHGELLVEDRFGTILNRQTGNGILNSLLKGGPMPPDHHLVFIAWDHIRMSDVLNKKTDLPYYVRLDCLSNEVVEVGSPMYRIVETKTVYSQAEAYEEFDAARKKGEEGTIIKKRVAIWKNGTSKDQIKLKAELECEMKVVGKTEGTGKNANYFGALLCESSCGLVECGVSGFTDAMRAEITSKWDEWEGSIITVRFNELVQDRGGDYSLFLPRFVELRGDKEHADDIEYIRSLV